MMSLNRCCSILQVIFGLIALGLFSKMVASYEYYDKVSAVKYSIFAAVSSILAASVLLLLRCLSGDRNAATYAIALILAAYQSIIWLACVAVIGQKIDFIFMSGSCEDDTVTDGNDSYSWSCTELKIELTAWVFAFLSLLLWVLTLVVACLEMCMGSRGQSGAAPASQPKHMYHASNPPPQFPNYTQPNQPPQVPNHNQLNQPHYNPAKSHSIGQPQLKAPPV